MKKILTIAGSDTSGGAGIQADLRTFAKHNLYGTTALTVIVTMDYQNGWAHGVSPISIDTIKAQLDTAFLGLTLDTIKTGMLPTPEIIDLVASYLEKVHGKMPIVIDPVMVCKGDKPLFPEHAEKIRDTLIQYATIITPNLFEATQLAHMKPLTSLEEAKEAAEKIMQTGGCESLVIKGVGSLMSPNTAADLFYDGNEFTLIEGELINTTHTHGLGCTFASHVASFITKGLTPKEACIAAKKAISQGLLKNFALNEYVGTLYFHDSFEK